MRNVIGIDLRPTKVAVAPLRDGRLAEPRVQPTECSQAAALIDLRERWGGWTREPFTSASTKHVSVWERS